LGAEGLSPWGWECYAIGCRRRVVPLDVLWDEAESLIDVVPLHYFVAWCVLVISCAKRRGGELGSVVVFVERNDGF
jgi:hypothetical protein